ncbi:hypothetical protein AAHA92_28739 [Salvia divinorum]|uniref:Uncharacterized protein n=1 Tax=Salvia divinorum TaxID=28513 RepID=A0ABD1FWH9_SALDI
MKLQWKKLKFLALKIELRRHSLLIKKLSKRKMEISLFLLHLLVIEKLLKPKTELSQWHLLLLVIKKLFRIEITNS